jgi:DNA primase large subunit
MTKKPIGVWTKPKCPKCDTILQQGKIVSEGYHHYCLKCDEDFVDMEVKHHDN